VFLIVGFLASKIMPGELPSFYMEIPPLRFPQLSNVLRKTWSRMKWYFLEVLPLFMLASVLIWIGKITGVFGFFVRMLEHPVRWIGLPSESAVAFLFGFFRGTMAGRPFDLKTQDC
jgi:ferrous iron transport protein B